MRTPLSELRKQQDRIQLKIDALVWLDDQTPDANLTHHDSCASQDMTGHPASCTCGFQERGRVYRFIKDLIERA